LPVSSEARDRTLVAPGSRLSPVEFGQLRLDRAVDVAVDAVDDSVRPECFGTTRAVTAMPAVTSPRSHRRS
jgi:hypothetical protein